VMVGVVYLIAQAIGLAGLLLASILLR